MDFTRVQTLVRQGIYAPAMLDQAKASLGVAQAAFDQASRQLDVAELGARADQQVAAQARSVQAKAAVTEATSRQNQLSPHAPSDAVVEDVFFRPGEWAPANQPVVSLLPDAQVKIRFFVGETVLAAYRPGESVRFSCDGCKAQTATITFVSPRAEFTPPVLYNRDQRKRLVFLIEARPERPRELSPGQPVDVTPLAGGTSGAR